MTDKRPGPVKRLEAAMVRNPYSMPPSIADCKWFLELYNAALRVHQAHYPCIAAALADPDTPPPPPSDDASDARRFRWQHDCTVENLDHVRSEIDKQMAGDGGPR